MNILISFQLKQLIPLIFVIFNERNPTPLNIPTPTPAPAPRLGDTSDLGGHYQEWPWTAADFAREDEADDRQFYDTPRLVKHIDDNAISGLSGWYDLVALGFVRFDVEPLTATPNGLVFPGISWPANEKLIKSG